MWWLGLSALAAPTFPAITTDERTELDCYPLLAGPGPLERLAMGGLTEAQVAGSERCVSPHARYYLLRDADVVVFLDPEGVVRTSHVMTADRHRAAIAAATAALRADRDAPRAERKALRKERRWNRRWRDWHGTLGGIARITGRQDRPGP